jgi:hypothetical protein
MKKHQMYYILDENKNAVPTTSIEWAKFLHQKKNERIVAKSNVGDYTISTVFIGLNHNWDDYDDKAHIFETMIFDHNHDDIYCSRTDTWKEAEKEHQNAINWINKRIN